MVKTLLVASFVNGGAATTAGATEYWALSGLLQKNSTEANRDTLVRTAGKLWGLYARVSANSTTASSTIRSRKNASNGGMSQTIGNGATGEFEDAVGSDTVAAGDKLCIQTVTGTGGTITFRTMSTMFEATTDTATIACTSGAINVTAASTTQYMHISGYNWNTAEANQKCRIRKSFTAKNMAVYISAARATGLTVKSRKNGADGNLVVTCSNSTTGWFEDTSHSDSLVSGDDYCYSAATSTGADTCTVQNIKCEYISTNQEGFTWGGRAGDPTAVGDGTTTFYPIGGESAGNPTATESTNQIKAREKWYLSDFEIMVSQNDVSSASTCDVRKGAASTTITISITGSTTGLFADNTHSEILAITDEINTRLVVPSVTGSHTVTVTSQGIHTANILPTNGLETVFGPGGSVASTANTTQYWTPNGRPTVSSTEADVQIPIRKSGKISKLSVWLEGNSITGTTTFTLRKNGADTGLIASATATGQALWEDRIHEITVAAGDKLSIKTVPGAATNTFVIGRISMDFVADDETSTQLLAATLQLSVTTASQTSYIPLSGNASNATTEARAKCRIRKAGTFKYFAIYISANARTTNTTFKSRKNGADGNLSIVFGNLETGLKEDTSVSDTVAVGDDYNYSMTTLTGSETLTLTFISCHFIPDDFSGIFVTGNATLGNVVANVTRTINVHGSNNIYTTEADSRRYIRATNLIFKELFINIINNGVTADSTLRLRVNGANGNLVVTITNATTGWFSDTTHTDTVMSGDTVNLQLVTGATGTSLDLVTVTMVYEVPRISKSFTWKYNVLKRVTGQSIAFDGTNDRINCGNDATLWSQSLSKFSYSIRFRSTIGPDATNYRDLVNHGGASNQSFRAYLDKDSGKLRTVIRSSVGSEIAAQSNADPSDSKWHTVVFVFDNSLGSNNLVQYLDKVLQSQKGNLTESINFSDILQIAGNATDLAGNAKDFRFWKATALTSTEANKVADNDPTAPTPDFWLPMQEGTGNPVDSIAAKTTTLDNGATWSALSPNVDGFGKQFKFVYKVIQRTSKVFRFPYNVKQRISKSFIFKYKVVARVSKVFRFPYKVIQRVSKTFRFPYNVVQRVSKTFRFPYKVVQRISKSFIFKYNVAKRISKSFIFKYNVLARISKPFTFLYNVASGGLTRISKSFIFKYNVQARISKQFSFPYNVRARITKQFRFPYNVAQRISKQFRFPYNVAQRISKQFRFKYAVVQRISKQFRFPYKVVQRVSKTFRFPYNVQKRISKSFIFKYLVLVRVTKSFIFKYKVVARVSKPFTFLYNVDSAVIRVSKQFRFVYNVAHRTSKQFNFKYDVRVRVTKQFRFVYNVRQRISKQFSFVYSVQQRISKSFRFHYNIRVRVTKTFRFPYNVRARISKNFRFNYNVAQRISKQFRFKYLVLVRISKTFSFKYNVLVRVSKQFRFPYKVAQRTSKAFRFVYNILAAAIEGLPKDPHQMVMELLQSAYPDNDPNLPIKTSVQFGQYPNNQAEIFIVCDEPPTTTDVDDTLDISQTVGHYISKVHVHVYVKSFNLLSPTADFIPQSDPVEIMQIVNWIETYIDKNPSLLLSQGVYEMEQNGTTWEPRRSWQQDLFHATVNVVMRYVE